MFLRHKNGRRVLIEPRFIPVFDENQQLEFVMEEFCEVGSQHIDNQMVRQLSNVAQHNQLTGIPNRRFLDDALAYRIILRKEMNKQFGVLFMDVDNFGKFNNTYGHEAGDLVLKKLTHTIISINRKNDIFGRWGGVETTARPCFRPLALSTAEEAVGSGVEGPRASRIASNTPLLV